MKVKDLIRLDCEVNYLLGMINYKFTNPACFLTYRFSKNIHIHTIEWYGLYDSSVNNHRLHKNYNRKEFLEKL